MVATVEWWELDRTVEPDHLTSLYVPALAEPAAAFLGRGGGAAGGAHGHAARALPLGPGPDPRVADAPPRRGVLRGARRPGVPGRARGRAGAGAHLQEELGDLLFQIVFHARLADEEGRFDLGDVARTVHDKLVHRHPHVFGDVHVAGADEVVSNWEAIKKTREGEVQRHRGHPLRAARADAHHQAACARRVRSGWSPRAPPLGRAAAATMDSLARRAADAEPSADDPLSGEAGELSAQVGAGPLRGGDPGATPRRRRGTGAARPRPRVARGHPRGRRRPRPGDWQPLTLCPGVPPGRAPKE